MREGLKDQPGLLRQLKREPNTTMARPTKYNDKLQAKADEYLHGTYEDDEGKEKPMFTEGGYVIPTIEGLARYLGVNRSTIFEWRDAEIEDENGKKSKKFPQFSDSLERVLATQKDLTLNNGLLGIYNPTIAKLLLAANHGLHDKVDSNNETNIKLSIISDFPDE